MFHGRSASICSTVCAAGGIELSSHWMPVVDIVATPPTRLPEFSPLLST